MLLDGYLEDKIYELAEEWISKQWKKMGSYKHKVIEEEPLRKEYYTDKWTEGEEFCKWMARQLRKAGYQRDAAGNKIDSLWFDKAWFGVGTANGGHKLGLKGLGGYIMRHVMAEQYDTIAAIREREREQTWRMC